MTTFFSSNPGYPRIGENREWKRALEAYWGGTISQEELLAKTDSIRLNNLQKQKDAGVDLIPVGDFSLYDHVLDTSFQFGIIPERFSGYEGSALDQYFAAARGSKGAVASAMTKWFNTNYHYMVPELEAANPVLKYNRALEAYQEAKDKLGIDGKPVILGPITYLKLAKGYQDKDFPALLAIFVPLYAQILQQLQEAGAKWVQIDEPIFGTNLDQQTLQEAHKAYDVLHKSAPSVNIILQTYFEHIVSYEAVCEFPVQAIGLDFVYGDSLTHIKQSGFPKDKVLAAGVIDGRNVWKANLSQKLALLEEIKQQTDVDQIIVQPSCSLLHVPVSLKPEKKLDAHIKDGLSFADEKLAEIKILTQAQKLGRQAVQQAVDANEAALNSYATAANRKNEAVRTAIDNLKENDARRASTFADRIEVQHARLQLPLLPTTTIGSLPQTSEVRQTRTKWRKGEITTEAYETFVQEQIKRWITVQEDIGLDVLVHGEFERTDMVEYFGEKLLGFTVTQYGWVQSYGSRCVKPPLIFGDVAFDQQMTVKESVYAQSLTDKPVKGMLTGPTTILNWSFVNDHVSRDVVRNQIALALREEIAELEKNGITIIQVDEPALREGLPLDKTKHKAYLDASVFAFRLAAASVKDETQVHTHMCYSEFSDIYEAIDDLDADVISIETSRSHGNTIAIFEKNTYDKEIGLGVYDIHSPRIPGLEEVKENIQRALHAIQSKQFWINPDCGLKTRNEEQTVQALKVMVQAATDIRNELLVENK